MNTFQIVPLLIHSNLQYFSYDSSKHKFQFAFIRTSGILVLVHLNLDFSFHSSEVPSLHIKITAYWMTTDWNYGLLK